MNAHYAYGRSTAPEGSTGPRAKCDQVIFEALCKACEMIVASRGEPPPPTHVSSRFNLTLPEHASVRQILQKWRRALHLPLRLDVYYQHPTSDSAAPPQRELLERWCFVYAPPSSEDWAQYQQQQQRLGCNPSTNPTSVTLDPIVQLRLVCKKIVVWLRTLYCMARMLPATTFLHHKTSNVGFSLYAISEGSDDHVQLQQQGFHCQPPNPQPSYLVGTPYGVLTWKVLTAEASVIHRLSGNTRKQSWNFPTTTVSRAIPIVQRGNYHSQPQQQQQQQQQQRTLTEDNVDEQEEYYQRQTTEPKGHSQEVQVQQGATAGHPRAEQFSGVPRSAPAHMQASPLPTQGPASGKTTVSSTGQPPHPHRRASTNIPPNTYQQPSQFRERLIKPTLERRHTSIGNEGIAYEADTPVPAPAPPPPRSGEAKRVLSGLSLAMMTLEDQQTHQDNNGTEASATTNGASAQTSESKEKRRAALHQAPPHRRSSPDDSATSLKTSPQSRPLPHHQLLAPPQHPLHRDTSQEYGYAYNSHIPWQKIHPSHNHPSLQQRVDYEDSPSGRATPAVLGSTPPPMLLNPSSHASHTSPSFGKHLLPPRSGSSGTPLTPPFPNRPSGFVLNTESPTMLPAQGPPIAGPPSPLQPRLEMEHAMQRAGPQPLTSLDLLHQSPFSWNPNAHGSMLSSLTMPDSTMMDLKRSLLLTHHHHHHHHHHPTEFSSTGGSGGMDWAEEMPFVVEEALAAPAPPPPQQHEDFSSLGASTAVASLAQKCTNSHRLQLFESRTMEATDDALTSQLADFRAFGASLIEGGGGAGSSSSSAVTNTTPTALRT